MKLSGKSENLNGVEWKRLTGIERNEMFRSSAAHTVRVLERGFSLSFLSLGL